MINKKTKNVKGIFYALLSSGTFGLIPLFSIPLLNEGMATSSILFYRFLLSTIIMGAICLVQKHNLRIGWKKFVSISGLGLLYAATALFLLYSYNFIPSGIATTIHFLYPILVSLLMIVFFKEKKSIILFIAAVLSLIGVVCLCWTSSDNIQIIGLFVAAATIVTYALYIVGLNQSKAGKMNAEVLTFYVLLSGVLIFFVYALATTGIGTIPSTNAFGRLLSLAILATVISDLTLILAIKNIGSTVTSILGSMEPMVAVLVGVFYFSEHFDYYSLLGVVLIILSVSLVVSKTSKKN